MGSKQKRLDRREARVLECLESARSLLSEAMADAERWQLEINETAVPLLLSTMGMIPGPAGKWLPADVAQLTAIEKTLSHARRLLTEGIDAASVQRSLSLRPELGVRLAVGVHAYAALAVDYYSGLGGVTEDWHGPGAKQFFVELQLWPD